jgi:ABC-type dipeptide/oligopeptide/nickel transport system ATPase component
MTAEELRVEDLRVSYRRGGAGSDAVAGVSFDVRPGEVVGIVGESGSGKSSIAQCVLRLLPKTAVVSGRVSLAGTNLLELSESEMCNVRGSRIGMVFQDPAAALNPVFHVQTQIVDTLRRHRRDLSRKEARERAAELVEAMGIPAARLASYPHQLSGGMRQRVLIAAAMACDPAFLVADEPTSDLDTISQAQILGLLQNLREERNIGVLLISHDMGVISAVCDRVGVMSHGQMVEFGPQTDVLLRSKHPYTRALVRMSRRDRLPNGRFVVSDEAAVA